MKARLTIGIFDFRLLARPDYAKMDGPCTTFGVIHTLCRVKVSLAKLLF